MKAKLYWLIAIVCATVLISSIALRLRSIPSPTLTFVAIRPGPYGQVALFRAANTSHRPFSYLGYGPSMPWFYRRVATASGFRPECVYDCGTGAGYIELPPHSTRELTISISFASIPSDLGIYFEQGTPAEISNPAKSPLGKLRRFIRQLLPSPDPTWSE
jgi:hypothetical protein